MFCMFVFHQYACLLELEYLCLAIEIEDIGKHEAVDVKPAVVGIPLTGINVGSIQKTTAPKAVSTVVFWVFIIYFLNNCCCNNCLMLFSFL